MQKLSIINDIILHSHDIERIVRLTAHNIIEFYRKKDGEDFKVHVFVVREGAIYFARAIFSPHEIGSRNFILHEIKASSYQHATTSTGSVSVFLNVDELKDSLPIKNVLIVDDIYDTGRTLYQVKKTIQEAFQPESIESCVMISRHGSHLYPDLHPRFIGRTVTISDFLIGCGLDYKGKYRDLSYVGTLKVKDEDDGEEQVKTECLCNKCGRSCTVEDSFHDESPEVFYGLINAEAKGGYFSPILGDCMAYRFDLCEKCLHDLFQIFTIPVEELEYDPWTGAVKQ